MAYNTKGRNKIYITEESMDTVLQRYSIDTILALFKEMAQDADDKMDWKELVRKSSTGITNAREYQMVWRCLAYATPLEETVDDDAEPLDDDSDLDCELETMPPVAHEVSAEAAAYVKVLIASDMPSKSTVPNGFTKDTEPLDTSRCSAAEDKELIASVQKYGEGNCTNIAQGDFKSARSASQLSKRWNILKEHKDKSCSGISSQLSGAHHPMTNKLKASSSPAGMSSATILDSMHQTAIGIKPEPQFEVPKTAGFTTKQGVDRPEIHIKDDLVSITGGELLEVIEKDNCGDDNDDADMDTCD